MEHIDIDLGSRDSQVCVRDGAGAILKEARRTTTKLGRWLADRPPARVVIETCTEAFRLAGIAQQHGHDVRVVFVFVDADVAVPRTLLHAIHMTMSDPACVGGGVDVDYEPRRPVVRVYLRAWRLLGRLTGMVQGATQFCRKDIFEQVGGYDERVWIGEDVDFYWALKRLAKQEHRAVRLLRRVTRSAGHAASPAEGLHATMPRSSATGGARITGSTSRTTASSVVPRFSRPRHSVRSSRSLRAPRICCTVASMILNHSGPWVTNGSSGAGFFTPLPTPSYSLPDGARSL